MIFNVGTSLRVVDEQFNSGSSKREQNKSFQFTLPKNKIRHIHFCNTCKHCDYSFKYNSSNSYNNRDIYSIYIEYILDTYKHSLIPYHCGIYYSSSNGYLILR